ncbi:AAA family ATPase [Mycoplasma struthionis]|uniref:AAA family ATPase n=1 Tax=Mycoplasma struthionis TaxID=538220 RepID=UPI001FE9A84D|nr:AAA family ATPase [Mycoplasma struthionis]
MKLIQVEAHGFKSFADRVNLKFDGGVVAIIGPNGSGKSNINDAIRWVLGENSSNELRGSRMEDVIFAGSKTEKEMDRAEVTLTFDNHDRSCSLPYDVFTISRVLYRGKGSNEYYINGELARQRDIKEIALESGISKSSLAIISQGKISDIAEDDVNKRRKILDDAAGTSMHRTRKEEAQRKLDKTQEALDKINVLVEELEKQLAPLERKANKARIYLEKFEQLKEVEISLLVHDYLDSSVEYEQLKEKSKEFEESVAELDEKIRECKVIMDQSGKNIQVLTAQYDEIVTKLNENKEKIQKLQVRIASDTARREMLINGELNATPKEKEEAIKQELNSLNSVIVKYEEYLNNNKKAIEEKKAEGQGITDLIRKKNL